MAESRVFELDELLVRPGTYLNPQTEVLVVVDDSPDLDASVFNMEDFEGSDWVLVSDDSPIDENRRDELLERFQAGHHAGAVPATEDEVVEEEPELDPDVEVPPE